MSDLSRAFNAIDTDGDGVITKQEFKAVLEAQQEEFQAILRAQLQQYEEEKAEAIRKAVDAAWASFNVNAGCMNSNGLAMAARARAQPGPGPGPPVYGAPPCAASATYVRPQGPPPMQGYAGPQATSPYATGPGMMNMASYVPPTASSQRAPGYSGAGQAMASYVPAVPGQTAPAMAYGMPQGYGMPQAQAGPYAAPTSSMMRPPMTYGAPPTQMSNGYLPPRQSMPGQPGQPVQPQGPWASYVPMPTAGPSSSPMGEAPQASYVPPVPAIGVPQRSAPPPMAQQFGPGAVVPGSTRSMGYAQTASFARPFAQAPGQAPTASFARPPGSGMCQAPNATLPPTSCMCQGPTATLPPTPMGTGTGQSPTANLAPTSSRPMASGSLRPDLGACQAQMGSCTLPPSQGMCQAQAGPYAMPPTSSSALGQLPPSASRSLPPASCNNYAYQAQQPQQPQMAQQAQTQQQQQQQQQQQVQQAQQAPQCRSAASPPSPGQPLRLQHFPENQLTSSPQALSRDLASGAGPRPAHSWTPNGVPGQARAGVQQNPDNQFRSWPGPSSPPQTAPDMRSGTRPAAGTNPFPAPDDRPEPQMGRRSSLTETWDEASAAIKSLKFTSDGATSQAMPETAPVASATGVNQAMEQQSAGLPVAEVVKGVPYAGSTYRGPPRQTVVPETSVQANERSSANFGEGDLDTSVRINY